MSLPKKTSSTYSRGYHRGTRLLLRGRPLSNKKSLLMHTGNVRDTSNSILVVAGKNILKAKPL